MAFREKMAWLTLATMAVAYGIYFSLIGRPGAAGAPRLLDIVWTFGPIAAAQAIVVIIGAVLLAITARREARAPADERDRAIARRGSGIAYYILLVGMILVGIVMPFSDTPFRIVNAALAAIVLAEAVRHIVILLSYRRGWHG